MLISALRHQHREAAADLARHARGLDRDADRALIFGALGNAATRQQPLTRGRIPLQAEHARAI
jgi:hypothetical protein